MRSKVQKVLSTTQIILTLIPLLTLNVLAGYNGSGDGETGGNEGSEYSWNQNKQGYRISIIDESGKLIGTPVDILFSTKPSASNVMLWTCKTESYLSRATTNKVVYADQLMYFIRNTQNGKFKNAPVMPKPMAWLDGPIGQGEDLRQWMTKGRATITRSSGSGNAGSAKTTVKPSSGVKESKTVPQKKPDETSSTSGTKIVNLSGEGQNLAAKIAARANDLKGKCSLADFKNKLTRYTASIMYYVQTSSGLSSEQIHYLRTVVGDAYKAAVASESEGYLKYTKSKIEYNKVRNFEKV